MPSTGFGCSERKFATIGPGTSFPAGKNFASQVLMSLWRMSRFKSDLLQVLLQDLGHRDPLGGVPACAQ